MTADIQHTEASRILSIIQASKRTQAPLTYTSVARQLGRGPGHAKAVAQMCDLLDAAAAYAGKPLLALTAIRSIDHKVNPKAWATSDVPAAARKQIVENSLNWQFKDDDYAAISQALNGLSGLGNRAAWKAVQEHMRPAKVWEVLSGIGVQLGPDPDVAAFEGNKRLISHLRRERNRELADHKRRVSQGVFGLTCESCKKSTKKQFPDIDAPLWEVHHRLPLGEAEKAIETKLEDLAIVCPTCHRAIHRTDPMMTVQDFGRKYFGR